MKWRKGRKKRGSQGEGLEAMREGVKNGKERGFKKKEKTYNYQGIT